MGRPRTTWPASRRVQSTISTAAAPWSRLRGAVRDQFEAIRALTDAEQDPKELKSAKRAATLDQIIDGSSCRSQIVAGRRRRLAVVKDDLTRQKM